MFYFLLNFLSLGELEKARSTVLPGPLKILHLIDLISNHRVQDISGMYINC